MIDLPEHFVSFLSSTVITRSVVYLSAAVVFMSLLIGGLCFWSIKKKKSRAQPKQRPDRRIPSVHETFEQLNGSSQSVLLAANRIQDLPATVPINLAIRLAEKGKCLLIDFDNKRDAMAKAFGVDSSEIKMNLKARPVPTPIENLEIWPACFFNNLKQINLKVLLAESSKRYDHILLYAPYLPVLPDRNQIAYCSKQAIVFSKGSDSNTPLYRLLRAQKCSIVNQPESLKNL